MALKLQDRLDDFDRRARARLAASTQDAHGPLADLRATGRAAFEATPLPGPKTESWKYSRVGPLLESGLLDQARQDAPVPEVEPFPGLEAGRVLILDGWPRQLPDAADGVTVTRFSAATGAAAAALERELGRLADPEGRPFVALNGSLVEDGVLIHVAAGVEAPPLELVIAQSPEGTPHGAHPRVLVVLETSARATLIERHVGTDAVFTNTVIEVRVADAAALDHMRLQLDAGAARSLTALDVRVGRDGRYGLHQALQGSLFRRNEIRIWSDGTGAEVTVGGATLSRNRSHLDTQMCLEHAVAHGTSNQIFRALAGERSKTVLNGRIHIHPDAQKTSAELSTRNLVLSADAEIDAKPELEIYADDVKCAHGATLGRLDEQALFYLRSRGVTEPQARAVLSFAFLAAVVDAFPLDAVRDAVRPALEAAFVAPPTGD